MIKEIYLDNTPCTLKVVLQTHKHEKLWIKLANADQKNTFYTKRYAKVDGMQTFYIRLPQAPKVGLLIVYNDNNKTDQDDKSFVIRKVGVTRLETEPIQLSKRTKSFIRFAQEFCEKAGVLQSSKKGEIYKSNNGQFRIDYFDKIRGKKSGKVITTPARISQRNGKIEVSEMAFKKYSVPMRMAILLHEFSHFYLNKVPSSEIESDRNGLMIYLSLGYPRIDAYNVFLNVFKDASNNQTYERFRTLDNFIKQYDYARR